MPEPMTYNDVRFVCRCGRFLAQSAIREEDYRDPSAYYGVGTRVEWDCARCGTVQGESWEPPLVVVATRALAAERTDTEEGDHA